MASTSPAPISGRHLSIAALISFSWPAVSMGALSVAFAVYLPQYYASHIGVGAMTVATVFSIVRLIDIGFDPAIGMVMDRTRTRFGRYRAWLMLGAPVFMIAGYLAFMAKPGVGMGYMIVVLLLVYVGQSIINLSQTSWAALIAPTYDDRSRLFGAISFLGVIGAGALLLLPAALHAKSSSDPGLLHAMGWFMIISAPLGIAWTALRTPEKLTADTGDHAGLADYWALLIRPEVLRIMASDICLSLGPLWMASLYLYFYQAARGFTAGAASILLFLYIIAGLVGAPLIGRMAVAIGKHRGLMVCSSGYSLALIALFFIPRGAFWIAAPFMGFMGFLAIGFTILIRALLADIGDMVRLETGRQSIGLLFALITLTQKLASAFSIILTFRLLPVVGFNTHEGARNTPAAIHGLELIFLIGPIVFVMLGGACFINYRLDSRRHADIRGRLEARDALNKDVLTVEGPAGRKTIATAVSD